MIDDLSCLGINYSILFGGVLEIFAEGALHLVGLVEFEQLADFLMSRVAKLEIILIFS